MKTKIITLIMLTLIGLSNLNAQIGIGTTTPEPSAKLDVTSPNNDRGFLPPRLTTAQRDAIATPAAGLVIYNTTDKSLQFYNGTSWVNLIDGSTSSCTPISQPIANVPATVNNTSNTNVNAINDGVVVDDGIAMSNTSHYMVLDLGSVYDSGTEVKFDIWGNNLSSRTVRTAEIPAGNFVSGGGSNPQTNNVNVNSFGDYTYILQNSTRFVQVEMTVRVGGRTEFVEATVIVTCP